MTLLQTVSPNRVALHVSKQETNSAEIGALALVFEKSATEPNRKITMTLLQTLRPNLISILFGIQGARSAQVGALALMFEKLAAELKPKQNS